MRAIRIDFDGTVHDVPPENAVGLYLYVPDAPRCPSCRCRLTTNGPVPLRKYESHFARRTLDADSEHATMVFVEVPA